MDKKKIIAIILFVLFSLFIFTFASPAPETLKPTDVPGSEEKPENKPEENEGTLVKPENSEKPGNVNPGNGVKPNKPVKPTPQVNDKAPIIKVNPKRVVILKGDKYDVMTGIEVKDELKNVKATASITDTSKLEVGKHEIIYTAVDKNGNKTTAKREIVVLDPKGDNDNDKYTNEEEIKGEVPSDPENEKQHPEYLPNPSIDFSKCETSMIVFGKVPNFEDCVEVTDGYYGKEDVDVNITTDIKPNEKGTYDVVIKATDVLGNETKEEFEFTVLARKVKVVIDNKTSVYNEDIKPLTSNAKEVEFDGHDIGVKLVTEAKKGSKVGSYPITGTWTNKNYEVEFVNGQYEITQKTIDSVEELKELLGVEFNSKEFTYNGKEHKIELTIKELEEFESNFKVEYKNNSRTNVGSNEATATIETKENSNYKLTNDLVLNATITVNQKQLDKNDLGDFKVNIPTGENAIYNGKEHEVTVEGLNKEFTYEVIYTDNVNAGNHSFKIVVTAKEDSNYKGSVELTDDSYKLNIAKANITIKADDKKSEYNEALEKLTYKVIKGQIYSQNGVEDNLNVKLVTNPKLDNKQIGSYEIKFDLAKANNNYNIKTVVGTYEITKNTLDKDEIGNIKLVVPANAIYNGKEHKVTVEGLNKEFSYKIVYTDNINAGSHSFKVVVTANKDSKYTGSVELINDSYKLNIAKASITIEAEDKQSEIGQPVRELTYKVIKGQIYSQNKVKDDLNEEYVTYPVKSNKPSAIDINKKGRYVITINASNDNYDINTRKGFYKVFEDLNNNDKDDDFEKHYTVIFKSTKGGKLDGKKVFTLKAIENTTLEQSKIEVPKTVANEYYKFVKWTPSLDTVINSKSAKNYVIVFTAIFEPKNDENNNNIPDELENKYTIEFKAGEYGSLTGTTKYLYVLPDQTLEEAGIVEPTVNANENYKFIGWTPTFNKDIEITKNLEFVAVYEKLDTAPVIEVNPERVVILEDTDYNFMDGVTITDEGQPEVTVTLTDEEGKVIDITDKKSIKLDDGTYTITYTAKDETGKITTATRTLVVLDPDGDDDGDKYTNEEELNGKNPTNPEDINKHPNYQPNPSIDFSKCPTSMTQFEKVPNFNKCVTATDEYYGKLPEDKIKITHKINPNEPNEYDVIITATDNLNNSTTETFKFKVLPIKVSKELDVDTKDKFKEGFDKDKAEPTDWDKYLDVELDFDNQPDVKFKNGQYEVLGFDTSTTGTKTLWVKVTYDNITYYTNLEDQGEDGTLDYIVKNKR